MKDILIDTCIDSIKLIPFLFIAFWFIELFEHKLAHKTQKSIIGAKKFGPFVGALLGAIPQCGFASVATNLYVTRIISLGTLISIYLSTSDEMLPILLSHNTPIKDVLIILGLKVAIGMVMGVIIDFVVRKQEKGIFSICEEDHCDCKESIIKSALTHTLKTIVFIFGVTFILNILMSYVSEDVLSKIFMKNSLFAPIFASLIGLIPNCAASVVITEFYLNNVVTLGTCLAGLLTNSGLALIVLFKTNKNLKDNLRILALVYFIGVISGIAINLLVI